MLVKENNHLHPDSSSALHIRSWFILHSSPSRVSAALMFYHSVIIHEPAVYTLSALLKGRFGLVLRSTLCTFLQVKDGLVFFWARKLQLGLSVHAVNLWAENTSRTSLKSIETHEGIPSRAVSVFFSVRFLSTGQVGVIGIMTKRTRLRLSLFLFFSSILSSCITPCVELHEDHLKKNRFLLNIFHIHFQN